MVGRKRGTCERGGTCERQEMPGADVTEQGGAVVSGRSVFSPDVSCVQTKCIPAGWETVEGLSFDNKLLVTTSKTMCSEKRQGTEQ